jgi:hypothetical protein
MKRMLTNRRVNKAMQGERPILRCSAAELQTILENARNEVLRGEDFNTDRGSAVRIKTQILVANVYNRLANHNLGRGKVSFAKIFAKTAAEMVMLIAYTAFITATACITLSVILKLTA